MAEWHLKELKNELERNRWKLCEVLDGDDYKISAYWLIERLDGSSSVKLAFHGMNMAADDLTYCEPIERAHAVYITDTTTSLYFGKKHTQNNEWEKSLKDFVQALNQHS